MKVAPDTAAATLRDDRGPHHFCSRSCLETYLDHPEAYPPPATSGPNGSR